jgi:hypothetical protein
VLAAAQQLRFALEPPKSFDTADLEPLRNQATEREWQQR